MLPILNITDEIMTSSATMDISGSFRPEDLSKTDFFDFVSAPPEVENEPATQSSTISEQQPLQGFDQVCDYFYIQIVKLLN